RWVEDSCYGVYGCVHASSVEKEIVVGLKEDLYAPRHRLNRRRVVEQVRRQGGAVVRRIAGNRQRAGEIFLSIKNVIACGIVTGKFAQYEITSHWRAVRTDHFVFENTDGGE